MLKSIALVVCAMGVAGTGAAFWEELRAGKLYPSLAIASFGWAVGFLAALVFMEWE